MGTMIGGAVQSILQASAVVMIAKAEAKPTIRCTNCGLNQFDLNSRPNCARCHRQLRADPPPPTKPIRIMAPDPEPADVGTRICLRIKVVRELKGITQKDLARGMGTPRTYLTKVENCKVVPTLGQLERLTKALGITMYELTDESVPAEYLARATLTRGGSDCDVVAALLTAGPLDARKRKILLEAAKSLRSGQLTFADWIKV